MNGYDLDTGALSIGRSWASAEDVDVTREGDAEPEWKDWSGRVDVGPSTSRPGTKRLLDSTLHVRLKNLRPVVHVIARNVKLPWIVEALSNQKDATASAHLTLGATSVRVSNMRMDAGSLQAEGNVAVTGMGTSRVDKQGALLVGWGLIRAGVELDGDSTRVVLVRAQHWYDTRGEAAAAKRKTH